MAKGSKKSRAKSAAKSTDTAAAAPAAPTAPATTSAAGGPPRGRRIVWSHVSTVISATILIGAEVFGAAFAGSWALATLFGFGFLGARILDVVLMLCGLAVMVQFVRAAHRIEPFTARH